MRLENYDKRDGYRVVLTDEEREDHFSKVPRNESKIGWGLAAYGGLRRQEIEYCRFKDVCKRSTGDYVIRVWEDGAKRSKYRETPIPANLVARIETVEDERDVNSTDPIVTLSLRTVSRDVKKAAEVMSDETDDEGWSHLGMHDGRRTWANSLLDSEVSPLQIMQWGGWDDWRTFKRHYLQDFSEKHQSEELDKVPWM